MATLQQQEQQQQQHQQLPDPDNTRTSLITSHGAANQRLSASPASRITFSTSLAFVGGFALGVSQGGTLAALRFRAENAHRLPTNRGGWYLYHKAKNWHVAKHAVREGVRMGLRISPWVAAFLLVEHAIDCTRDADDTGTHKDFLATTIAGTSIAGAFSFRNGFPLPTAARTVKTGLLMGITYGLAQDAVRLLRGEKLAWYQMIFRS